MKAPLLLFAALSVSCVIAGCAGSAETAPATEPAKTETSMNSGGGMVMAASGSEAAFKVSGMDCSSCASEVKGLISAQDGVKDCTVDPSGAVTVVLEEGKTSKEELVKLVNDKTNYKASL